MFIYRIYNIDTQESYVGQTTKTVDYRFKEHIREAKRSLRGEKRDFTYFHRMLLYYGIDNFKAEIIEEVDKKQADERERFWIEYYDSYFNGYNSTLGGQNRPMSELMSEANNKWKKTDSNAKKPGMNIKDVIDTGRYDPTGNTNAGKPVAQYTLDNELIEIYPAASVASKETGISVQGIRKVCNGKQLQSGGFFWEWVEK